MQGGKDSTTTSIMRPSFSCTESTSHALHTHTHLIGTSTYPGSLVWVALLLLLFQKGMLPLVSVCVGEGGGDLACLAPASFFLWGCRCIYVGV